jgi:NAD(P)-dependent dehydrogenase (short-subunit alcohol dehydrogenase family)
MSDMRTRATQDQQTATDDGHPLGRLTGKAAIITGGDSGIGRATAVLFAREGASLTITYRPGDQLGAETTAALVNREGQRCRLCRGDLEQRAFCDQVVAETLEQYGRLDILVNNAAAQDDQKDIIYAYLHMARAAVPYMGRGGAIINVGSIASLEGRRQLLEHSASKSAIQAFTRSLAQSLVSEGIRVNAVAPGPVWTPLDVAGSPGDTVAVLGQDTPMNRPAQPEEIAPAIVFLASSSDAGYISGEILSLLGAEVAA